MISKDGIGRCDYLSIIGLQMKRCGLEADGLKEYYGFAMFG